MEQNYYPSQDPILKLKQEMKLRNLSQKTIKSYTHYIFSCLQKSNKSARSISAEDVRGYLEFLADTNVSASTLNTAYSALKFYFETILYRKFFFRIPRARKTSYVPVVLSKEEIGKMLSGIVNKKHHCIVSLLYGAGLRVGELVRVRMCDIDLDRMLVRVFQGKGKKDRMVILPLKLKDIFTVQSKLKKIDDFLFTNGRGSRLTEATIQKIVSSVAERVGIKKHVSPHTLRHSFATHLLEGGTDIRYIQELLGHARLQITQIYTKVAVNNLQKIKSPLD